MRFICSSALAATAIVWSFRSNVPVEAFVPTSTTTPIHKSAVLTTRIQNNAAPHHCHHRRHVNAAKRFRLLTYQGFGFNNDSVSETATNNHDFIMDSAMADVTNLQLDEFRGTVLYGSDSMSYKGLTPPTQAAFVLAGLVAAGMVVASPEIDTSVLIDADFWAKLQATTPWSSDQLSFDWDMNGLSASFQQVSQELSLSYETKVLPFLSQQQNVLQNEFASFSTNVQTWTAQASSQTNILQNVAAEKFTSFGSTVNEAMQNAADFSVAKANELQNVGQGTLGQLQQVAGQVAGQMQSQYASLEAASQAQVQELVQAGSRLQEEGSRLWAQYSGIAMDKYAMTSQAVTQQMEQAALQIQGETDRLLLEYAPVVTEKVSIVESGIREGMEQTVKALDLHERDALRLMAKYNDIGTATYRSLEESTMRLMEQSAATGMEKCQELEKISLAQMDILQNQLAQASENIKVQSQEDAVEFKAFVAQQMADSQPFMDTVKAALHERLQELQSQLREESNRMSFQGQQYAVTQYDNLKVFAQGQMNTAKEQYLPQASIIITDFATSFDVKTKDLADQVGPASQEARVSLLQNLESARDTTSSVTRQLQSTLGTQTNAFLDAAQDTSQRFKDGGISQLADLQASVAGRTAEAQSTTADSVLLKSTLKSMLD